MPVQLQPRKSGGYVLTATHVETGQLAELPFLVIRKSYGFDLWAFASDNDDEMTLHESGLSEAEVIAEAQMMMPPYWR